MGELFTDGTNADFGTDPAVTPELAVRPEPTVAPTETPVPTATPLPVSDQQSLWLIKLILLAIPLLIQGQKFLTEWKKFRRLIQ